MTDLTKTLSIRAERYGPFASHAALTQQLKACVRQHDSGEGWKRLSASQREGLEMILHKVARVINGDPDYDDSWIDIAGYAQRVVQVIHDTEGAKP